MPVGPACLERHPCQLGHEIEFRWPDVAKGRGTGADLVTIDVVVMRDRDLIHLIYVLVEAEVVRRYIEWHNRFARSQSVELWQSVLNDETPTRCKVRGGVTEASHLLTLGSQIRDCVEDEVDEGSIVTHSDLGHVTNRHRNEFRPLLLPQFRQHWFRKVDSMDSDPRLSQGQRDASSANRKLDRGSVAGQIGQNVDGRTNRLQTE